MILDPHPESDQHQNLTTSIEGYPLPVKFGPHPLTRSWANLHTAGQTDSLGDITVHASGLAVTFVTLVTLILFWLIDCSAF